MNKNVLIPLVLLLGSCSDSDPALQSAVADTASPSQRLDSATPEETGSPSATRAPAAQASLAPAGEPVAPGYNLELGEIVFTNTCLACHGNGAYNAPVIGNAPDWESRLNQSLDTLIQHAIQGHRSMPPKGGFFLLNNQEVAAAVAYVVDKSQKILLSMKKQEREQGCDPIDNLDKCSKSELEDMLTLQLFWLLGGGGAK